MSDDAAPAIATLLTTCREACDEFTPFVHAVYSQLNADPDAAVRKADASFFSLADGVVQVRARAHAQNTARLRTRTTNIDRMTITIFDERC